MTDQEIWDERYRSAPALWSGQPNPQLVSEVTELHPGTALDVGCGEGADAIWLAQLGWNVTAVDVSAVALERAEGHARDTGVDVSWVRADVTDWILTAPTFDLVSAQFMHLPKDQRVRLHQRLATAVARGGTLLLVGHHPSDVHSGAKRPGNPELLFTAMEVATLLTPDEWAVVTADARPRPAVTIGGEPTTVHDAVLRARRT